METGTRGARTPPQLEWKVHARPEDGRDCLQEPNADHGAHFCQESSGIFEPGNTG